MSSIEHQIMLTNKILAVLNYLMQNYDVFQSGELFMSSKY